MARQVRSEAARRKIIDAAIDVFAEVGYAAAWNTVIERTGMTKGALYRHFEAKESLASSAQARRISTEGYLRQDVDPLVISESIVGAMFGTRSLSNAISVKGLESDLVNLTGRTNQMWELLPVGVVAEASLPISGISFVAKQCAMPRPPFLATAPPSRQSDGAPRLRCWADGQSRTTCKTLP
jgi:AcrR family transcriptional regulator